ncbi:hexokinase [Striga asiatica]|uniref:Hexokinase n=1 Tax=Striga asiatica TaxID=4170 RepID=A0A5A7RIK4_STRAF|nr:hexokinase [Striga asiatica]
MKEMVFPYRIKEGRKNGRIISGEAHPFGGIAASIPMQDLDLHSPTPPLSPPHKLMQRENKPFVVIPQIQESPSISRIRDICSTYLFNFLRWEKKIASATFIESQLEVLSPSTESIKGPELTHQSVQNYIRRPSPRRQCNPFPKIPFVFRIPRQVEELTAGLSITDLDLNLKMKRMLMRKEFCQHLTITGCARYRLPCGDKAETLVKRYLSNVRDITNHELFRLLHYLEADGNNCMGIIRFIIPGLGDGDRFGTKKKVKSFMIFISPRLAKGALPFSFSFRQLSLESGTLTKWLKGFLIEDADKTSFLSIPEGSWGGSMGLTL